MRLVVNLLALVCVVIAVFMVGTLYVAAATEQGGMGVLFLQAWGAIGSLGAVAFGFIGRLMDRRVPRPAHLISNASIAIGLLAGLLLFAAPMVFG